MRDVDAVTAANEGFYEAFMSLEIDRMDAVWAHHDAVCCVHPGWEMLVGWPAVRQSWEMIFANTERMRFETADVRVRAQGDVAWVALTERLLSSSGGVESGGEVVATNVFERAGDLWLMVNHHASPIPVRTAPRGPTLH